MTPLDNLPYSDYLSDFCVCNMDNRFVILSGGQDYLHVNKSAKVHALETSSFKWQPLPDLNVARSGHSSTCFRNTIYVVCGVDNN